MGTDGRAQILLRKYHEGGVDMPKAAEKTVEQRIKSETKRLLRIFADLDPNKLQTVNTLICRVAFATVSLQDLEMQLARDGWVEEYQNGENQSGVKQSASAGVYLSLTKNLNAMVKQLVDLVPAAQRESKLEELMRK
nr:MAG TPA: hypothetical protein [Caudoviricetes sp.]